MRRTRSLTSAERWELGTFLAMLMVASLCGAVLLGTRGLPKLMAVAKNPTQPTPAAEARPEMPEFQTAPEQVDPPKLPVAGGQPQAPKAEIRYYAGKPYKYARTLRLRVTAYSPDARSCWPYDGTTTASGASVKTNHGHLVAADTRVIPMHSVVSVPGYHAGQTVPVLDRGGKIQGHRLDILLPTFEQAREWGSRVLSVKIYEPVN